MSKSSQLITAIIWLGIRTIMMLTIALIGGIVGHSIIPGFIALIIYFTQEILLYVFSKIADTIPNKGYNTITLKIILLILLVIEVIAYILVLISIF